MERLTEKLTEILNVQDLCLEPYEMEAVEKALRKLRAYEGTGMEPEAVEQLKLYSMGKAIAEIKEFDGVPINHICELIQAEKDGRLVVLPFPQGRILLDRSYQQNPELLKNFRVAIAYDHSGIVFHQPLSIFLENVKRGYITVVSKEDEAVLKAQKGGEGNA